MILFSETVIYGCYAKYFLFVIFIYTFFCFEPSGFFIGLQSTCHLDNPTVKLSNNSVFFTISGTLDLLSGDIPKGIKINSKHLDAMIELHNVTNTFAKNIQHLFLETNTQVLLDTVKAIYTPFETFKQK